MADLTITSANVALGGIVSTINAMAGESVTEGEVVYLKGADRKYWLADADAVATAKSAGIALTPAAADGYFVMAQDGPVDVGATLAIGTTYVVSTTAGAIAPIADLGSGDFVTVLGIASATDQLDLHIQITGVAKA